MLLVSGFGSAVLDLVRGAMEFGNDPPWTREGVRELVNLSLCRIRANSSMSEIDVANGADFWIRLMQVDQFAVVSTLLLNQKTCGFSEG